MEKGSIQATVDEIPQDKHDRDERAVTQWRPGYVYQLPWVGIGSLIGIVLCAVVGVVLMVVVDGRSANDWPKRLPPNVCISAVNAVANFLLTIAIGEGIAIAWWRKAMKGATVAELHRAWLFSMSSESILRNYLRLDTIALAALAAKVTIADSLLLQRALEMYTATEPPRVVTVMGVAATEFPSTGYVVSNTSVGAQTNCDCYMIGDSYTPVVNTWETSNGFFQGYQDLFQTCDGVCYTHVQGVGFEIACTESELHTNLATNAIAAWDASNGSNTADASKWSNIPIFNSSFTMSFPDDSKNYSRLNMRLEYFQSDDPYNPSSLTCPGKLTQVQCELRPALVRYPIKVMNYNNPHVINGVSLSGGVASASTTSAGGRVIPYSYEQKQAEGFEVLQYVYPKDELLVGSSTFLGGIANAFSQYLASLAAITYAGNQAWGLKQQGILAQTMMYGPPNMGSCDCSFKSEALSVLVSGINQLAFLTSTGLVDKSSYTNSSIEAGGTKATVVGIGSNTTATWTRLDDTVQMADATHYRTNYLFLGLGIATMLLCVALVLPSYWRYGELGRKVTMGPMEVASAFGAPILTQTADGQPVHGKFEEVIDQVGSRQVQYGFVVHENDYPDTNSSPSSPVQHSRPGVEAQGLGIAQKDGPSVTTTAMSPDPISSPDVNNNGKSGRLNRRSTVMLRMEEPRNIRPVSEIVASSPEGSQSPRQPNIKRLSRVVTWRE